MKITIFAAALLISTSLHSQYYYNDIVSNEEVSAKMKVYTAAGVKSVTAAGYDAQGRKTTDFNEWQDVQANGTILKITSRNGQVVTRVYYQFDDKKRVINSRDSSGDIQNITDYKYDAGGRLVSIKTITQDSKQDFNSTEERVWQYDPAGKPQKMWRIINSKDSSEYRFTIDSSGNVSDERLFRRSTGIDPVYYYYDEDGRLTDIVRYNRKVKKLIPEVSFIYDDNNRVIQRVTTLTGANTDTFGTVIDYLIWRYAFNEKGLKTREAMFGKAKQLKGRIDYAYTFTP